MTDRASGGRIPGLDGVRGIAILLVIFVNAGWVLEQSNVFLVKLFEAATATGWTGVQLFFVLSGFLITGILLDAKGSPRYFHDFYVRRTLRIFPLYYAFLALVLIVAPLVAPGLLADWIPVARHNQWWYVFYVYNWGSPFGAAIPGLPHFWSLAVEEQFYLMWPLVVWLAPRRGLTWICVTVVLITPFIRVALRLYGLPPLATYEFTISRWDALAAGGLLAILAGEPAARSWLSRHMGKIGAVGIGVMLVFVLVKHGFHEDDFWVQVLGQSLIIVIAVWLVHVAIDPAAAPRLGAVVSWRWLRFLGKYSYAIYVVHFPIREIGMRYLTPMVNGADDVWRLARGLLFVGGVLGASIVLALISWRFLEKPCLDLRERFAPTESGAAAAARRAAT